MSFEAVDWALKQKTDEPVDKLILISIANFAGEDHSSFPSRKKLADVGMCSLDTVDRANRRLEALGLIRKETRLHPAGGKASNCYILAVGTVAAPCGQDKADCRDSRTIERPGEPQDAVRVAASECGEGSRILCGHKEPVKEPLKEPSTPLPPRGPTPTDALQAFEAYNATALRCAIPQAAKLTPDRSRKIIARLKDYGLEGWQTALANIEKSSFLTGKNDKGWTADLEFMLRPANFAKLHDGGYGNGRHAGPPSGFAPTPRRETEDEMQQRIIAELERECMA